MDMRIVSCIDAIELVRKHRLSRYPAAIITDLYGHDTAVGFESPYDVSGIEIKLIDEEFI